MQHLQQLLNDGGAVMYLLLLCSIIAVFIILNRVFHLHRARIDVQEFIHGLFNVLRRNSVVEAVAICDETPGPVASVVRAAILRCDQDEPTLRKAVEEASLMEIPRLERWMKLLATIGQVTPLLGLLGTVVGMIGAFDSMQTGPFVETARLAKDVRLALLTTAAGLSISIPTFAFYNYLVGRVETLAIDMDKAAAEMIYFITHNELTLGNPEADRDAGSDLGEAQLVEAETGPEAERDEN
ncbi:MAG: MotA/TolQ/ExbB proton channel family protein [Lentisphaeria bacterium]|nr:MotA/TolQ/ExbB proton channel family protein [Lentisphaeria bacterium]